MIKYLRHPEDIDTILGLIQKRLKVDQRYVDGLQTFCYMAISSDTEVVLLATDSGGIKGFIAASFMSWQFKPVVLIQSTVAARDCSRELKKEIIEALEFWGRTRGATAILGFSSLPDTILCSFDFTRKSWVVMKDIVQRIE